jgi:hypothetical protein
VKKPLKTRGKTHPRLRRFVKKEFARQKRLGGGKNFPKELSLSAIRRQQQIKRLRAQLIVDD